MNWDALQDIILSTLNHVTTQQLLALELVAIIFRLVERRIKLLNYYIKLLVNGKAKIWALYDLYVLYMFKVNS